MDRDKHRNKDKKHLHTYLKQTSSILGKIKTIKSSNKKNKESFSQVNGNNSSPNGNSNEKIQLGFSMEGLEQTGGSNNDMNTMHSQMSEEGTGTSSTTPLDSKQSTNRNIDLNEIDKIQNDILKTLKRLGDS